MPSLDTYTIRTSLESMTSPRSIPDAAAKAGTFSTELRCHNTAPSANTTVTNRDCRALR
ncbi:MAG: hypothetical protein M5T61_19450 [Acidimicrobiia bacterium]|nr:hypothetical protein [Acidimicrobiia bacterium]